MKAGKLERRIDVPIEGQPDDGICEGPRVSNVKGHLARHARPARSFRGKDSRAEKCRGRSLFPRPTRDEFLEQIENERSLGADNRVRR